MQQFPPASELRHLVGDTLMQVCLDPFSTQFHFERNNITSGLAVEQIEPDGTTWNYKCVAAEAPATMLHRLVGKQVTSISSDGLRMSIGFDNGAVLHEAVGLQSDGTPGSGPYVLHLLNNERVRARSVVIATGVRYRRLEVPDLERFEGSCVHYWTSPLEGKLCAGQEVALVGAGNSAGQAVVYLAS